jgi:deazaflavin-dependent oxidoreductase (nitroreductase family)
MAQTVRVNREKRGRPPIATVFGLFTPFNALMTRFAGSRYLPLWAIVRHRGRRSGREYSTPVAARRIADGFVIPLAFGESADWTRNVLANHGAEIRWKDRTYKVVDPVILQAREVIDVFPAIARPLIRGGAIEGVMRVRDAEPSVR